MGKGRLGKEGRKTPRATVSPSLRDIAWAAGFYEGEGYCQFSGSTQLVLIAQNEMEPLLRLQELFGGSIYKPARLKCNRWCLFGARARGFLMTIYPFLFTRRRKQALRALYPEVTP